MLTVPAQASTLLVLGDSISAAYGMETEQGWVALLARKLESVGGYRVVNASISGETTSGGISRLPALLERTKPDLVLIELGANDALRGAPLAAIERNLERLVRQVQQRGAKVLLLGMRIPPNYGPRYSEGFAALYPRLGAKLTVATTGFLLQGVAGDSALMQADGLHPRAAAQAQILANVWPDLEPLLQ
ncbi:MAG TPA: arylesterase [Motiliproteus sp.]